MKVKVKLMSYAAMIFLCLVFSQRNPSAIGIADVYNVTCDPECQPSCESKTLETIAVEIQEPDRINVEINIKIPQLNLNTDLNFTRLNSLIIKGTSGSTTITCTASGSATAGILLSDINGKLILKNLQLISCGSPVKSKLGYDVYISALTIVRCIEVDLINIVISKSRGLGMVVFDHQGGKMNVTSTIFKENTMPQDFGEGVYGGGGVYLSLQNYSKGNTLSMSFLFKNCTFESNIARTKIYKSIYNDILGELRNGYGRGGGAYIIIKSGPRNIHLSFIECNFTGNMAFIGGGLSVNIHGRKKKVTRNVTVEIKNSLFQKNGCNRHKYHNERGFGGGANIAFSNTVDKSGVANCHYLIRNVTFDGNCAELGGGVFYYSYRGRQETENDTNSLIFDNCTFKQNRAHMGSAVAMTPDIFQKVSSGYTIVPKFQNCDFRYNKVFVKYYRSQETQRIGGLGTIYSSLYDIHFEGFNSFKNNSGSAIHSVDGIVNFVKSDVSIVNNTGIQGGAVALIGTSQLIVGRKIYEFINNTALYQGGAIYTLLMDSIDFISSRSCFIQYQSEDGKTRFSREWDINMTFIGNRASSGHAIYATSLHPCQVVKNGSTIEHDFAYLNASDVFTSQGVTFDDNALLQPQITTDGDVLYSSKPTPLMIIPGEKYSHGVVVMDDFGRQIEASFRLSITKKSGSEKISSLSSRFARDKIQLSGNPHQEANVYLWQTSPRRNYIKLEVKLVECPPGFRLNDKSICVCDARTHVGITKCDLDNFHSYLLPGYWAGVINITQNRSELVTCRCPFCDYRKSIPRDSETEVILPKSYSNLSRTVCGETRTGVVCGRCREGYTVHFHSPGFLCKPAEPVGCKLGWLFYILSELVPVTVVFITVLVLNISFTSGAVNGFILFGQLLNTFNIDASGIITFPESEKYGIKRWTECYRIIYGFINFEFFISESLSFCLWKGASALDMLALKYVTILYTLLLIGTVIWVTNKCGGRCCGKFCRITTIKTSVVHGISTFLVICYAQCVKVSLDLLIPVWLEKTGVTPHARVLLNGELLYFGRKHLLYALPALLCLVTIGFVPPVLLLAYPLANKIMFFLGCNDLKVVTIFSKIFSISSLKPLLDSIQGCFKDNMRFFAGLYFLYRWMVPFIHVVSNGFGIYYSVLCVALLFVLTTHAMCQPYIKKMHNIIDTFLFADLVIINSLSFLNYYRSQTQWSVRQGVTISPSIIQMILIYLPLIAISAWLIVVILKKIGFVNCRDRARDNRLEIITNAFASKKTNTYTLRELLQSMSTRNEDSTKEEEDFFDQLAEEDTEYNNKNDYLESQH